MLSIKALYSNFLIYLIFFPICIYINACITFFSGKEVLAIISSLRTYYSKELGKVQNGIKSGTGRHDIYISKWAHFNSMTFLRDTVIPRKSLTSMVSLWFVLHCLSLILSKGWGYGNLREEGQKLFPYTNYWKWVFFYQKIGFYPPPTII